MSGKDILYAMNGIDEKYIEEAEILTPDVILQKHGNSGNEGRKRAFVIAFSVIGSAAACFVCVLALIHFNGALSAGNSYRVDENHFSASAVENQAAEDTGEEESAGTVNDESAIAAGYLDALLDIYAADEGLNGHVIGLDMSEAPGELAEKDIHEIAERLAEKTGDEVVTGTRTELTELGYITDDGTGSQFIDGCLITVTPGTEAPQGGNICFTMEKWASSAGMYGKADCYLERENDGTYRYVPSETDYIS